VPARGIVRREVTRLSRPARFSKKTSLNPAATTFSPVYASGRPVRLALLDLSTGAFWIEESASLDANPGHSHALCAGRMRDSGERKDDRSLIRARRRNRNDVESLRRLAFRAGRRGGPVDESFRRALLDGVWLRQSHGGDRGGGAVLHYVTHELRRQVGHVADYPSRTPPTICCWTKPRSRISISSLRAVRESGLGNSSSPHDRHDAHRDGQSAPARLASETADGFEGNRPRHDAVEGAGPGPQTACQLTYTMARVKDLNG